MFIQQENTKQIAELVHNSNRQEQLNTILSILAHNSDAEMEQAFKQSIRENPHDSSHRLIYADWLEENGRPTEAHLHRMIAETPIMMERLGGPYGYRDPSIRYRRDGQRRRATPREATRTAYVTTVSHTRSTSPDRQAREHAKAATEAAKIGDKKRTIEHHYQAAIAHLQQANSNVDWKTAGRLGPYSEYVAAHSHIIAAGVHKGEYPTENA